MFDSYICEVTCEEFYSEDTESLWAEVMAEEEAYASSFIRPRVPGPDARYSRLFYQYNIFCRKSQ